MISFLTFFLLLPLLPGLRDYNKGFEYRQIASYLLGKANQSLDADECEGACVQNPECLGWEVCAPLGQGCDGCYMVKNTFRPKLVDHPGWHVGLIDGRYEHLVEGQKPAVVKPTSLAGCKEFLLKANGGDPNSEFHKPESMEIYTWCGEQLLAGAWSGQEHQPKDILVLGQHFPTSLITNFRDPAPHIPADVEMEMRGKVTPNSDYFDPNQPGSITNELHNSVGTHAVPTARNHALVVPFYDTNIGHWIKEFGSMNVLQSYEMQSLLRPGDVVVDVGANLGSYTIPFAERVGRQGKVLAFEPFRWLHQLCTANVALNGLSNVFSYNLGLSDGTGSFEARPPQLRFFSSPGGVKLSEQEKDMKQDAALQLYDYELEPEYVSVAALDDLLQQKLVRVPDITSLRLIKIDVEGMESKVIMGAQKAIMHFKPIVWSENVEYFEKGDTGFLGIMAQLNYQCGKAQNAPNDLICTDKDGQGNQVAEVFQSSPTQAAVKQEL